MSEKLTTYIVTDGKSERLISAANKAQVRAHLVKPIRIDYAEQPDLIRLLSAGVKVETAANGEDA